MDKGVEVEKQEKMRQKRKKRLFVYSFAILDLGSGFYVGYGASLCSEKAAFEAARALMVECGVEPASIWLDHVLCVSVCG